MRPGLALKNVLLHDNAPSHTAAAKVEVIKLQLLSRSPYSPDLAPCDFYLFSERKKMLAGNKYKTRPQGYKTFSVLNSKLNSKTQNLFG